MSVSFSDFMTRDRPYQFPGAVFLHANGRPYAIIEGSNTNMRQTWVYYWHPDKKWVSLEVWDGEPIGARMSPEYAAHYGIIDSGQELKP